jgi:tRNA(Ser,Leu) C12 N-acetylase TAN1
MLSRNATILTLKEEDLEIIDQLRKNKAAGAAVNLKNPEKKAAKYI